MDDAQSELIDNYQREDEKARTLNHKPASHKMFLDTERPLSKMTKTTAASMNFKQDASTFSHQKAQTNPRKKRTAQSDKFNSQTAVAKLTKPMSQKYSHSKTMKTAGEILNYPYTFDQDTKDPDMVALDSMLAKQRYEEQYRVAEIQQQ